MMPTLSLLLLTFGCRVERDPPTAQLTDTGSLGPTSTPSTGWSTVRIGRESLTRIVTDGATTWALDIFGGVMVVGDPWQELVTPTSGDWIIDDADARDGAVWAVSFDLLGQLVGDGWSTVTLPSELRGPKAVAVRGDGTVAVLAVYHVLYGCYGRDCALVSLGLWDGADWSVHTVGPTTILMDLVETDAGDLVAVGEGGWVGRWDGADWIDLHGGEPGTLRTVAAEGSGIVAVGDGLMVRGALGALAVSDTRPAPNFIEVSVGPDGLVWALTSDAVWVEDGSGWAEAPLPDGRWGDVHAIAGQAIAVGDQAGPLAVVGGVDGWSEAWHAPGLLSVQDAWVDSDGSAWFAASGTVGRWDATGLEAWRPSDGELTWPGELLAISGTGPSDVVAIGDNGVLQWDGAAWSWVWPVSNETMWDVSVSPDGTAFVVASLRSSDEGQVAALLRRDAGVWSIDPTPIPTGASALFAVHAFAVDDVYALTWSEPAALLHFDGAAWTDLTGDLGVGVDSLWGRSGTDLYLGRSNGQGAQASVMHWDGAVLTDVVGGPPNVTAIAGGDTALIVAGTDEYRPVTAMLRDGVWTEMFRGDGRMAVGGAGDHAVVTGYTDAWRGPMSTWHP